MSKILLVEDDRSLALQVSDALKSEGHLVDVSGSAGETYALAALTTYDLIILDWELPDGTGLAICRQLRADKAKNVPVLFLTARAALADKEQGFIAGADDYLTKPFHLSELLLRVKALLRRPAIVQPRQIKVRDLILDLERRQVSREGVKLELFPKEYALLEFLIMHPNQIFSADQLLNRIWPTDSESSVETVRVTMMRVRQRLGEPGGKPLIVTLRNIGYRLEP